MGFLGNLVSGVVKVALTPVAVVVDAGKIVAGSSKVNTTKNLLASAGEDLEEATDDLGDGELL